MSDALQATAAFGRHSTIGDLQDEVARLLALAAVPLARDEARDMVAALLDLPRFWPTLHAAETASGPLREQALRAATRRAAGAPFAYAVRRAPYRHLTLDVDERVLIPRQETELLPELVLGMLPSPGGTVVDVGTGSGALALALASEGDFDRVIATDVSLDALDVARANVARCAAVLRAPVELRHGAGLSPLAGARVRAIVSNPPYIAFDELHTLPNSVRDWEPALALVCGQDGLAVTATLVRDAVTLLEPSGVLVLEVDVRRAGMVVELIAATGAFSEVSVRLDLTGRERFVLARRDKIAAASTRQGAAAAASHS